MTALSADLSVDPSVALSTGLPAVMPPIAPAAAPVMVVDHPLVQHKVTLVRSEDTTTDNFRRLVREIAQLLTYEATRDLAMETVAIKTPIAPMQSPMLSGKKLCLVSILRGGTASSMACSTCCRPRGSATSACTATPKRWSRSSTTSRCPTTSRSGW